MSSVADSAQFSNIGAVTTSAFQLKGGKYGFMTKSTGAGTIDLQTLSIDGSTWLAVATQIVAVTGYNTVDVPPGQFRVVITGFTANFVTVTRVPS